MPTQVQFRRGTTNQNNGFTGASGEISFNTSNNTLRVHDGSTPGGFELTKTLDLTTANVTELTNLYFTNARANVSLVTANVVVNRLFSEGNISSNAFITSPFFYSESDIALKENIRPIDNALDKILNMFGVSFDWKSNKSKSLGVIAQDVEKVVPEIVSSSNGHKVVSYDSIIPLLIEAIKQQQIQIDTLKTKLDEKY